MVLEKSFGLQNQIIHHEWCHQAEGEAEHSPTSADHQRVSRRLAQGEHEVACGKADNGEVHGVENGTARLIRTQTRIEPEQGKAEKNGAQKRERVL